MKISKSTKPYCFIKNISLVASQATKSNYRNLTIDIKRFDAFIVLIEVRAYSTFDTNIINKVKLVTVVIFNLNELFIALSLRLFQIKA